MNAALLALLSAFALSALPAHAADWSCESATLVIPYPAGGPTDALGRMVAKGLTGSWAKNVVVLNRPGGGTTIGTNEVVRATADGCTMGVVSLALVTNPIVNDALPFNTARDVKPVTLVATFPGVIVVTPGFPANTPAELVGWARKNPGKLAYATTGAMGFSHLTGEMLGEKADVDLVHVPYKGSSAAYPDVISGRVPMMIDSGPPILQLIKSGKVRAVAVTSAERNALLPDVPTLAESGFDVRVNIWLGLVTSSKVADDRVLQVSQHVRAAVHETAAAQQLESMNFTPQGSSPAEFRALLDSEQTRWSGLIKKRNIKSE